MKKKNKYKYKSNIFYNIFNLNNLFINKKDNLLKVSFFQYIEPFLSFFLKIISFIIFFICYKNIVIFFNLKTDTNLLISIFILPLIISFGDFLINFNNSFIKISKNANYITVKRGFFSISFDKLYIKDVNNIELYKTFFGKMFNYSKINLYALGGVISIEFLKDNKNNYKIIKKLAEIIQKNQNLKEN